MTTEKRDEVRIATLAHDLEALFGKGWRAHVAQALGISATANLRRMFTPPKGRTDSPPESLFALVEFLKVTPRGRWPERWKGEH